jgi:hypothetical protein
VLTLLRLTPQLLDKLVSLNLALRQTSVFVDIEVDALVHRLQVIERLSDLVFQLIVFLTGLIGGLLCFFEFLLSQLRFMVMVNDEPLQLLQRQRMLLTGALIIL